MSNLNIQQVDNGFIVSCQEYTKVFSSLEKVVIFLSEDFFIGDWWSNEQD